MRFATQTAIEKAKKHGVAWVGARMSNHAGPAALYATMPLAHDMVGIYLAVGSNNHLPPWGAMENLLGTNPIAIAIPAGDEPPIVLDMAPTVAAFGKVRLKAQRGRGDAGRLDDRPRGQAADRSQAHGRRPPGADRRVQGLWPEPRDRACSPARSIARRSARTSIDFIKDLGKATNTGHAIVAISVEAFMPVAQFKRAVDEAVRAMRGAERLPGVERVWLPGEQSHLKQQDRAKNGIPMPKPLRDSLDAVARDLGIAPLG